MKKVVAAALIMLGLTGTAQATFTDEARSCVRNLGARVQTYGGHQVIIPANQRGYIKNLPVTAGSFIIEWDRVFTYVGNYREEIYNFRAITYHTQFAVCD